MPDPAEQYAQALQARVQLCRQVWQRWIVLAEMADRVARPAGMSDQGFASGSRGLALGRVFTESGTLVATVAQEGLIPNLISFNVGVEIGQFMALAIILILILYVFIGPHLPGDFATRPVTMLPTL